MFPHIVFPFHRVSIYGFFNKKGSKTSYVEVSTPKGETEISILLKPRTRTSIALLLLYSTGQSSHKLALIQESWKPVFTF